MTPPERPAAGVLPYLDSLLEPSAYDHPVGRVELIQTHISYVLLAGDFAYKLKKPLDLGFLDYTTLERRHLMCEEEVRLNRRLCPDAYLGVVPVTLTNGRARCGGTGDVADYAVKMKRVPHERAMPALLERRAIGQPEMRSIALTVADFHATAETDARIAGYGRPDAVQFNWDENFGQARPYIGRTISRQQCATVRSYANDFLRNERALLDQRADDGRVRDSHGDLRADSVIIRRDGGICIMDCIEFSERIRCCDTAADLAFLAMDLERRQHPELSDELLAGYLARAADETLPLVWRFYRCYRAFVRGKVDSFQLDEESVPEEQKREAFTRAAASFRLAEQYANVLARRVLVMMAGLSGTGKSYIANALAGRLGAVILSSDAIRASEGARQQGAAHTPYGAGGYSRRERVRVYEAMRERATRYLSDGRSVILDATHIRRADRRAAQELAARHGVPVLAIEVTATDASVRAHFERRTLSRDRRSDADWNIYLAQRSRFDPVDEFPEERHVLIDGAAGLTDNLDRIEARVNPLV